MMARLIAFFHTLPNIEVFLLFLLIPAAAILLPFVREKVLRIDVTQHTSDSALEALKVAITFTGVLLAFTLVQVQQNFRAAEALTVREANEISDLDRTLLRYGSPEWSLNRARLGEYTRLIASDEWQMMKKEERSTAVDAAFNALSRSIRMTTPEDKRQEAMFAAALASLDKITDLREERLGIAEGGMPELFWWAVCGLFSIILLVSTFMQATIGRLLAIGGMVSSLALLAALVVIVDGPFVGDTSVQPRVYLRTIDRINTR